MTIPRGLQEFLKTPTAILSTAAAGLLGAAVVWGGFTTKVDANTGSISKQWTRIVLLEHGQAENEKASAIIVTRLEDQAKVLEKVDAKLDRLLEERRK